jgi:glycerol uptake facilitator-like aquaporin
LPPIFRTGTVRWLDRQWAGSYRGEHIMLRRLVAEFLGTFWLVLGGCGSAVLAAKFGGPGNPLGIGLLGVSLAFGLTVVSGAYALGHISGAHFNPAVTLGLWAGGRFPIRDVVPYIVVQVIGGVVAGDVQQYCASGAPGWSLAQYCCTSPAAPRVLRLTLMRRAALPATVTGRCRRAATR